MILKVNNYNRKMMVSKLVSLFLCLSNFESHGKDVGIHCQESVDKCFLAFNIRLKSFVSTYKRLMIWKSESCFVKFVGRENY